MMRFMLKIRNDITGILQKYYKIIIFVLQK